MIFSLAVFALLHADQGWAGIVNAAALGMAFTFVYFATGSIVLPIVLHALNNMYVLAALPVVGWRASRRQFDERLRMERLRAGAPGSISG